MKILLAIDGSQCSLTGVHYVIKHRGMFGPDSRLTLLYVDTPFVERAQTVLGTLGIQQAHEANAAAAFLDATRLLEHAGIAHETVMKVGDAGPRIARYATDEGYDLVVIGSHGHGALAGLMLGSVVTKVLAVCTVAVLVTR